MSHSCCRAFTRYIYFNGKDRVLFKNKGNTIFNYSTKQYDNLLDTPDRDTFKRFLQIKDIYLSSKQKWVHFKDVCVKIKTVLTE